MIQGLPCCSILYLRFYCSVTFVQQGYSYEPPAISSQIVCLSSHTPQPWMPQAMRSCSQARGLVLCPPGHAADMRHAGAERAVHIETMCGDWPCIASRFQRRRRNPPIGHGLACAPSFARPNCGGSAMRSEPAPVVPSPIGSSCLWCGLLRTGVQASRGRPPGRPLGRERSMVASSHPTPGPARLD